MRNMKTGKKVMAGTLAAIMVSSAAMTAYAATEHWNDGSQGATTEWTQWKQTGKQSRTITKRFR